MNIQEILNNHQLWLDTAGNQGKRASLERANLNWANLYEANLEWANLKGTYLYRADLFRACLKGVNLTKADLFRASLAEANLESANLTGVDLEGANLYGANLLGAILEGANLWNCTGNGKEIKNIFTDKYTIAYTKDIIFIGCKGYTQEEWLGFTDEEIDYMDEGALTWWESNRKLIEGIYN